MINQSTAIVRKLKQYFDHRFGLTVWDKGEVTHFGQGEDDLEEYVGYQSSINGRHFSLKIVPPEFDPPLGRLEFHALGTQMTGPFDTDTLERVRAHLIGAQT